MDDVELIAQTGDVSLFAYPARLIVSSRGSGDLSLAALIKDISNSGAALEFEADRLPDSPAEKTVGLEFISASGNKVTLSGRVRDFQSRGRGQAAAWIAFENIHLPQVDAIKALLAIPHKDHRLLWELWDSLHEGGA